MYHISGCGEGENTCDFVFRGDICIFSILILIILLYRRWL
jgi:hypothetical protein